MQSIRSSAPATSETPLDAVLLELARRAPSSSFAEEVRHLLHAAATAAGARTAALWLFADEGETLRCAARYHADTQAWDEGAEARGAWPGTSALTERRWATDRLARLAADGGDGTDALDAGVWSGGALAGFVRLERGADRPWTDAEGAFAAAIAERAGLARERAARASAEEQLRMRNEYVGEVEKIARLGSWDQDLLTNRITWSAEQCRLHGVAPGEGPTDEAGFLAFLHPDDRQMVVDACAQVIRNAEPLDIPYRIVRPDGQVRWLAARGRAAYAADGRPLQLVGTSIDIHDRVLAEQAIRASETRFRELFEQFPDSVQVCAPDGSTLRVNTAYTRLWGRRLEDLAGMNLLDTPVLEPIREALRRAFAGEAVQIDPVQVPASLAGPHADPGVQWPRWIRASVFPIRDPDGGLREVVLVHEDVTEERRAADALHARERQRAQTQEMVHLGSWQWDAAADRVTWSDELFRIFGTEPGTFDPTFENYLARVHEDDRERVATTVLGAVGDGGTFDMEERIVRPDGAVRVLRTVGEAVTDAQGAVTGLVGACQDITGRTEAEQALRASEESYRTIFQTSNDAIFITDPATGAMVDANDRACELVSATRDELRENPAAILWNGPAPFTPEAALETTARAMAGEPQRFEWMSIHRHTGAEVWGEVSLQRVVLNGADRVMAVVRDIGDRKQAERALRASEASYRAIFESAQDAMLIQDIETGMILDANPNACEITGATLDELRANGPAIIWNGPPPYTPQDAQRMSERAIAGETLSFEWMLYHHRTGEEVWADVIVKCVNLGGTDRLLAVSRNIGERKRAEQALRASEESYRAIFESSNDAIFVHDLATGRVLDANARACELGGVTLEELRASGLTVIANGPPPFTQERAAEHLRKAGEGVPQRFEWMTIQPQTGEEMWVEVGLQRVTIRGEERLLALVRDARERKAAERAMRQSEQSYRTIFHSSSEAIWVHDLDTGAFLEVNQAACEMYGYTEEETKEIGVAGLSWGEEPFTVANAFEYIQRAIDGEPQRFEWKARHAEGHAVWSEVQLRRVTINGVDRLLATGRDIRDRKRYEAELERTNEELELRVAERTGELAAANEALEEEVAEHEAAKEALLERTREVEGIFRALPDLFFRLGADGTILDYRAGSHNKLAVPPEVFMWKRMQEVLPPVADATTEALERAAATGQLAAFEYQLPTPAGMGDYEARVVPVPDGTFITVIRDVTDAKQAQRALEASEERFRRMVANTYDIITLLSPEGEVRYENDAMTRLLGFTPEERVGRSIADNIHADDIPTVRAAIGRVLATPGLAVTVEYRYRAKDGTLHYLESVGRTLSEHSAAEGIVVNSRDVTERRAVQRALKESEEHFRTLIENSSDVATINDAVTGAVLYASPAAEVVLGWTPDELEGTVAADFVHPDDVHAVHERMQELLLDPSRPQTMRYRFRRRDGEYMVLETTARIIVTPEGDYRMVANARDVTDRTRAEEALRRNEEHFRALIENAQDIVLILDANGTMVYLSPPIERILGWTPEELTGKNAFAYMHQDDQAGVAVELVRVLAEPGLTGNAEYRFRDKQGRWRHLEAFGRMLETGDGNPTIVANVRDVTERHEAAEALRKSEEHFRALTENASDLITVLSAEGTYLYQSPSIMRLLGYTQADVLGGSPFAFMHPDDVAEAADALARMAGEPGTSHSVQFRFRHADGSWRVLESIGRTLLPDSVDEGIVVISRDVTERRRTEEALRAATEAAERANRAKSEFLSRMSHELRTPMNSILGFAQLLGRADLAPNDQKSVQHILKAGRHLLNLINEVLEIARIEAGRHNLSLEPVRVQPMIEEALGLVRPMAAQWGVTLEHGPAPENAFVRADRQRLAQVLLNLLSNAIKYNRPGGRVRLWCEPGDDGRLVIRVLDEGRGIPEENADQLFTPFARLGAEGTGVEGTGLGLALSQRLTEAMGGALTLERSGTEGSVFRVELGGATDPLEVLEGPEGAGPRVIAPGHGTATLLYVEDNLANLSLVETILLSRPGWRTLPALQGQIGVELAREHRPDLVLLDLHLPDIPGEEVLRRLRADRRTADIPIVVISADATRATAERLRALGADAYLSKPIDVDEFLETVERFLATREGA